MRQVNTHEARTHLSRLAKEAAAGEGFVICKTGRPMVSVTADSQLAAYLGPVRVMVAAGPPT